uniref:Ig-like domain-containing protein n=1 Tax=Fundulus heteroclitus TaxID=8078 RepID=A0A3Q2P441_FUNHE
MKAAKRRISQHGCQCGEPSPSPWSHPQHPTHPAPPRPAPPLLHCLFPTEPIRPEVGERTRVQTEEVEPLIVHHPSDVVVKLGNPATLSCRVDGSPKPTIEWLRNVQPMRGPSHEGVYACIARNSAGKAISRNASLYIAGEMGTYTEGF